MSLTHMVTLIFEHSDSDFDADDWASVGVPRAFEASTSLTQPAFDLPLVSLSNGQ